jgi:virginiamycin B lyase
MGDDKLGRLDPKTGQMSEVATGPRSQPRRIAAAPDGMMWVTLYGNGKLAKIDPAAMKVVNEYQLPAGNAGPYAVAVDGGGLVWVNEINTDTVVRLNPATDEMRVVKLPSKNTGIRKMIVDASGKLWYMGSHSGRLGVIE